MSIGKWLGLAGMTVLLGACGGTVTVLGDGTGGVGGAGSAGKGSAGETVISPGEPDGSTGGRAPMGGGGSGGLGGMGGPEGIMGVAGGAHVALDPVDAQQQSDKLDVLFVVDNSVSMADKQTLLAKSVPAFVARLVNPPCVDAQGALVGNQPVSGAAACSSGKRQFAPVKDMHLGAITTSLGGHGGAVCADGTGHLDDKAELLGITRDGVPNYQGSGYLSWDSAGKNGLSDATALSTQLGTMIDAAGDDGCGFEATLESMYRFLVDPAPPNSVVRSAGGTSTLVGVNQALLAQRAAFLRPDSSVAIVILSDENDCSIVDSGVGWFVGSSARMPRATEACATNPNDPCCRSCAQNESAPPTGCKSLKEDAICKDTPEGVNFVTWDALHDSLNLRCYNQQARFGFDLLNSLDRYSLGLTNRKVVDWNGVFVDNPLFAARDGKGPRSNSLVSVSVITGAAWQDLATESSLTGPNLTYLDAASLASKGRWPLLVGDPTNNVPPTDPLNIESTQERSGKSPLTNEPIAAATSISPLANATNGHEQNIPDLGDLQYACTFPLPVPVKCGNGDAKCNCSADKSGNASAVTAANSPLCQPPTGGSAGTTQYYAKGYPGTRQLLLARTLGARATPASICPREVLPASGANYGYVPALNALVDRLSVTLK